MEEAKLWKFLRNSSVDSQPESAQNREDPGKSMKKLLLVEDDKLISKTLKLSLHYRGFEARVCETAEAAKKEFEERSFDVVILDVNLPDGSGFSLCQDFKKQNQAVPVLMLTARTDEHSAVRGIESGADDYVRKPFGLEELSARLERLLGRKAKEENLSFQTLRLDLKSREAWAGETRLILFKREFDILAILMIHAGEVVSRQVILDTLDRDGEIYDRTIDSHLSHLRKKLKEADLEDIQLTPVYGVGYRLEKK